MLRLGVLGCGRVFERFHLPAIARVSTVALVAAYDIDPARLGSAAVYAPSPSTFTTVDALLAESGVEAVLILTPPATHADLTVRALEAGMHVLVEKPMALTASDGRLMAEAAARARRVLQPGFTRRFREPYRRLRAELEGGSRRLPRGSFRAGLLDVGLESAQRVPGGDEVTRWRRFR